MNLIDIYRTCHPKAREYTFFSSANGSKIDHMADIINLNKSKTTEIMSSIFSDYNSLQLEINHTHIHTHIHTQNN